MGLDAAIPMGLVLMMVCADPVGGASLDASSGDADPDGNAMAAHPLQGVRPLQCGSIWPLAPRGS